MPIQFIRASREEIITRLDEQLAGRTTFMDTLHLNVPIAGKQNLTLIDYERVKTPFLWRPKYAYEISPLISNFQKAMRLRDAERCLATALQLLGQDVCTFLRRLAIVLLEDAQLQPQLYAQVVWLMLATGKGYTLAREDVEVIMDAICSALMMNKRYDLSEEAAGLALAESHWLGIAPESGSYALRSAYVAMRLRAGAGGMRFDAEFLERLAARLLCRQLEFEMEINTVDIDDIPEFDVAAHMLPAAIDFHCYPAILETARLQTGLKPPIIKEAIWWHRSSLNDREGPAQLQAVESGQRFRTAQIWAVVAPIVSGFANRQLQLIEEKKARISAPLTLDSWLKASKMEVE